jgi:hypothetical protein
MEDAIATSAMHFIAYKPHRLYSILIATNRIDFIAYKPHEVYGCLQIKQWCTRCAQLCTSVHTVQISARTLLMVNRCAVTT